MATDNGLNGGGRLRVYLDGNGWTREHLRTALQDRSDFELLDAVALPHLNGNVDAVLHAADDHSPLAAEISTLRSRTQAPIILGAPAASEGLLEQALEVDLADVVLLPQPSEAIAYAIRRAVHGHAGRPGEKGRVLTVFSPKGGTGKTVVATNLAAALAASGHRTLLVDLDVQFGDVAITLGLEPAKTLHDLASDAGALDAEKLHGYVTAVAAGFDILAAPAQPEHGEHIDRDRVELLLGVARAAYEAVVVDTAPLFDIATVAALEASDDVLVVVTPQVPALKNVRLGVQTLERLRFPEERLSFLCNREGERGGVTSAEVEAVMRRKIRFALPDDPVVAECVNRGTPAVVAQERSAFARVITTMAKELVAVEADAPKTRGWSLRRSR